MPWRSWTRAKFYCFWVNLTGDINISAPTGYEISSSSGSGFTSNVVLPQNSGNVVSTSIYVRLSSTAINGASGNISLSSSGASSVDVSTGAATINNPPVVLAGADVNFVSAGSIAFDATVAGLSGHSNIIDIFTEAQSETADYGATESSLADPNWTS